MPKRTLTSQHRKAISEGLKLHHKRKRRSKTAIGRLVNKFTRTTKSQSHKAQRLERRTAKTKASTQAKQQITNQITALQKRLQSIRHEIQVLRQQKSKYASARKDQLHVQADAVVRQLQQLRKRRKQIS